MTDDPKLIERKRIKRMIKTGVYPRAMAVEVDVKPHQDNSVIRLGRRTRGNRILKEARCIGFRPTIDIMMED